MSWYQKAAMGGSLNGLDYLGYLYQKGLGVARNYHDAIMWDRRAAAAGSGTGMYVIGVCYDGCSMVEKKCGRRRQ